MDAWMLINRPHSNSGVAETCSCAFFYHKLIVSLQMEHPAVSTLRLQVFILSRIFVETNFSWTLVEPKPAHCGTAWHMKGDEPWSLAICVARWWRYGYLMLLGYIDSSCYLNSYYWASYDRIENPTKQHHPGLARYSPCGHQGFVWKMYHPESPGRAVRWSVSYFEIKISAFSKQTVVLCSGAHSPKWTMTNTIFTSFFYLTYSAGSNTGYSSLNVCAQWVIQ